MPDTDGFRYGEDRRRAGVHAFPKLDRLVIGEGETRDALQRTGRWLDTDDPADLGAWC